jgi:hypothetical protein
MSEAQEQIEELFDKVNGLFEQEGTDTVVALCVVMRLLTILMTFFMKEEQRSRFIQELPAELVRRVKEAQSWPSAVH